MDLNTGITRETAVGLLLQYNKEKFHIQHAVTVENVMKDYAEKLGYAAKPKDYKKNPEIYKGHVGDVSTVIRIALMGRAQSPDVWEIHQILGEERTRARLSKFL